MITSLGSLLFTPMTFMGHPEMSLMQAAMAVLGMLNIATTVFILCGGAVSNRIVFAYVYTCVAVLLLCDITLRGGGQHGTVYFVLIVDLLLVMRVQKMHTYCVVGVAVVWTVVNVVESSLRLGLYDLPGTYSQSLREDKLSAGECELKPCKRQLFEVLSGALGALAIFFIDFVATRGFAERVLKEQEAMRQTVATLQEIAQFLADYDVDSVCETLRVAEGIPEQTHRALETLESNLRSYRPYLPAGLFERNEEDDRSPKSVKASSSIPSPGSMTGEAVIAFTDIRSSTAIWESHPDAMRISLSVHNAIIRSLLAEFLGYEVKTIGDSFMTAFETLTSALQFGVAVHERLLHANWPEQLLQFPICKIQGNLWRGLTVRIGINAGPITAELNDLTGRMDYFGHVVNVAARLESVCIPGAIALPLNLWHSAKATQIDVHWRRGGDFSLKGISENVPVCNIWPRSLAGRESAPLAQLPFQYEGADSISMSSAGSKDFLGGKEPHHYSPRFSVSATIGVVELAIQTERSVIGSLNEGLETLTTLLDQSSGALISLFGNCACLGWNLGRISAAHAESALRFAQKLKMQRREGVLGTGLASGLVHHGDVGTRRQRFLTVIGPVVRKAWYLCEQATKEDKVCFYEPPPGTVLPYSLCGEMLVANARRHGVYEMRNTTYESVGSVKDVTEFET